ncbi:nitrate/nitrite transporter NarK [Caldalkalibacillus uzonensis]|uniref:Nitrate/nitrite transporter NarK n=1 Tax=Caldalkalibacillus uzonensis TaxID=353224 RepID=A0ABU0CS10_9BACI|nr:nitrate/nitrite transporter NarK [Caldalkalibacillus uzonensis]
MAKQKNRWLIAASMGLFNGLGRIMWASISDYIGRPNVYTAFFVIQRIFLAVCSLSLWPYPSSSALTFDACASVIPKKPSRATWSWPVKLAEENS